MDSLGAKDAENLVWTIFLTWIVTDPVFHAKVSTQFGYILLPRVQIIHFEHLEIE